jgi:hypothetical protein
VDSGELTGDAKLTGVFEVTGVGELTGLALGATGLLMGGTDPTVADGAGLAVGEAFAATAGVAPGVGEAIAVAGGKPALTLSPRVLGELPLWA